MSEPVQIARDPFARETLVRRVEDTWKDCAECGQTRPSGRLFRYGIERDDMMSGRISWLRELFCSVGCMRSYYG